MGTANPGLDLNPDQPDAHLYLHPPYTIEQRHNYRRKAWPLYVAATEGNWDCAQRIIDDDETVVRARITEGSETALHIAALANKVDFVKKLVSRMLPEELAITNGRGCTALCFAAVTGNVEIAQVIIQGNPDLPRLRARDGVLPIQMAVSLGHRGMVVELLQFQANNSTEEENVKLLIDCITSDLLDIALRMIKDNQRLAVAQDSSGETAFGVLAKRPFTFTGGSTKGIWRRDTDSCQSRNKKKTQYIELLKYILDIVFRQDDLEISNIIARAPALLFVAARLGNFEFVNLVIYYYPELIWKVDSDNQSIFHVAIEKRHGSIFTLLHKMDAVRSLVTTYVVNNTGDNMLHLAAKLAPTDKLNTFSGAAFQMQQEILWYKEVEKIVPPAYRNFPNKEGKMPNDIFDIWHEKLLKDGEKWIKATANSCMLVATLIATVIFTAAFTVPGGNDKDGYPVLFKKAFFKIFDISEVMALFFSAISILMFLSILSSRVTKHVFLRSLPCKLMIGVIALFLSIASMVVTFCTAIFLSYRHGSSWIPVLLFLFPCVPIIFLLLKFRLLVDILHSTFAECVLF